MQRSERDDEKQPVSPARAAARRDSALISPLFRAWAVLLFERAWRRFVPLLLIVLLFKACAWLNIFTLLWRPLHALLLLIFAVSFLASTVFLCLLKLPSEAEARLRLARDNNLRYDETDLSGEPLAPGASPAAQALWREHKKRLLAHLPALRVSAPRPDIPAYDKYALRSIVFLLFGAAFCFHLGTGGGRLSDAFYFGSYQNPADLRIDAWINPPDYTNYPPVYLAAAAGQSPSETLNYTAPAGSVLTVRVNDNGRGLARLRCKGDKDLRHSKRDSSSVYELRLTAAAQCRLTSPLGEVNWAITVLPDHAPQIAWVEPPERALNGTLKLDYKILDDYGAKRAWAEIAPIANSDSSNASPYFAALRGAPKIIARQGGSLTEWQGANLPPAQQKPEELIPPPQVALTLPRPAIAENNLRGGEARTEADLSRNPWAGAYVSLRLAAEDGAGQTAYSAPVRLYLPRQTLINPLARALTEQRRFLAENVNSVPRVKAMLNALLLWPEDTIPDKGAALALYSLRARLNNAPALMSASDLEAEAELHGLTLNKTQLAAIQAEQKTMRDAALKDIVSYMGAIAAGIDGADKLAAAEKRLREAQQALRDALRNGASDEEIARLMQNLRDAMNDYIAMLAQRGQKADDGKPAERLGESELAKRLKALEDAAKSGQRGAAEQMLSDLENLMKNLQVTQGKGGGDFGGKNSKDSRQSQMQKQMDTLSDIMRRQQQLLDDTHKNQEQALRGEGGSTADQSKRQQDLRDRQNALRQDLQNLQKQLQGQNLGPKGNFGEAQKQMQNSNEALVQGNEAEAQQNQADTLQALREDAQGLMENMRKELAKQDAAKQAQEGESGQSGAQGEARQDPLGRPSGTGQTAQGDALPQGDAAARARRILDEIRRRLGTLTPAQEKAYLERLLNYDN